MSVLYYANRVAESTLTIGTGTLALGGVAGLTLQGFIAAGANGKRVNYEIHHLTANEWEIGEGVVTAGAPDTLTRTGVYEGSNGTSLVSFSIGVKEVRLVAPASIFRDAARNDVRTYGAEGGGPDATAAFNAALLAERRIYVPDDGVYTLSSTVSLQQDGNVLHGEGQNSRILYTGAGTALDFNAKQYATLEQFKLTSITGAIGIDIGDIAHNFRVSRVHIDGQDSLVPTGFTTAHIQIERSYYGKVEHCDLLYGTRGIYGFRECNGNFIVHNSIRQCKTGIRITGDTSFSDGTLISGNEIESAAAGSLYAIELLGVGSMMVTDNRCEYTTGPAHIFLNSNGSYVAQYNELGGNKLEGTIPAIILGDGVGTSQVISTYIHGGRAAGAVTINDDCILTRFDAAPSAYAGTFTDDGIGSWIQIDPSNGLWYVKNYSGNAIGWKVTVGGAETQLDTVNNPLVFRGVFGEHGSFKTDASFQVAQGGLRQAQGNPTEALLVSGISAPSGGTQRVTLTAARVVGLPVTVPTPGMEIVYIFTEDATGGWNLTFNAGYKGITWTNTGNTAGKKSSIGFTYNGTDWDMTRAQTPWA